MTTNGCRARLVPWTQPWRKSRKAVARCTGKPEECFASMGGRVHTAYLDGIKIEWRRTQNGIYIFKGQQEYSQWIKDHQLEALRESNRRAAA